MQNSQRSETINIRNQDVENQLLGSFSPDTFPLVCDPLSGMFDGDSADCCKNDEEAYYSSDIGHCDITTCGHIDQGEGNRSYWQGACACGWLGERWGASPNTCDNADFAHRDYRDHVVQELGPHAFYDASVACRNCGSEHMQPVVIGTHVTSANCFRCGTTMLDPRNDAWDASRAAARVWLP